MLSDQRAAGFAAGRGARSWGGTGATRGHTTDRYAEEVASIRKDVATLAKPIARDRDEQGSGVRVSVAIRIVGHERHDPDSWLLAGKAIVDGLVTAGVLASDRRDLCYVAGRVSTNKLESTMARLAIAAEADAPGAIVEITEEV
jgi:hypothetical protein